MKFLKSRFFRNYWPILAVFLVVLAFAFPYWAKGLVPFPSSYLVDFFPPWNAYFAHPVKNNAMPDVISQIYPWRKLTIETLKSGQWSLWNPYNFAGNPHLANVQSAVFHPFNFLFFFLPRIDAWSLMILAQPLLAALFTYLFCRQLKLSRLASLLSSLAFGFCGFMVVWMAYGTLGHALLWLPLILYGIERVASKPAFWPSLLISLGVALSFFSGHAQTSFYVVGAALAYLLFRRASGAFLPFFLGLGLASPQLLPSIEFYQLAPRSTVFQSSEVIPWRYLTTLIAPDFYGNPVTRNDWFGHYAEWAGFIGVIPFVLATYQAWRKKTAQARFFFFLAVFALLLALPTPLLDLLVKLKIPVLSTSAASRIISLFSFSMAILAGFGFDQLRKDLKAKKPLPKILTFLGAWGLLFLGIWAVILLFKPFPSEWSAVAKRNFILPTLMLAALGGLIVGQFVVKRFIRSKKLMTYSLVLILLFSVFDLFRFAHKWMPFDPREYVYPPNPAVEFLTGRAGADRVFGNLGTETQTYFHLASLEGYDPLYPKRYGEFATTAGDGQISQVAHRTVYLNKNGVHTKRFLDLLGVKYLWHTVSDGQNVWAFPFWDYPGQFELIYQDEKHEVYENKSALPRAFLVDSFEVIKGDQAIINRLVEPDFDFSKTIILEEEPEERPNLGDGAGRAVISQYTPTKIKVETSHSQATFLFLSDNYYPGWRALVDGLETKIYRADYSFRAIFVPAGDHVVEFIYFPDSFKIGLAVGFFSLMGLLVLKLKKR